MEHHLDAMSAKVADIAEHEVAARNERYIPSWADDMLAFVSGFGVRAPGPKAVHVPGDRHLRDVMALHEKPRTLKILHLDIGA